MPIKRLAWCGVAACVVVGAAGVVNGQSGAVKGPTADVSTVVGCLSQEGGEWIVGAASAPLKAPEASDSGSTETAVQMAARQPAGTARYRLIGLLEEFNVASHKGHRLLVKGFVVKDTKETRLNLLSIAMVSPSCDAK